ncbi:MAG: DUF6421 family protein [Planctomycetota bacterium]
MFEAKFLEFAYSIIRMIDEVKLGYVAQDKVYVDESLAIELRGRMWQELYDSPCIADAEQQLSSFIEDGSGRLSCIQMDCGLLRFIVAFMNPSKSDGAYFEGLLMRQRQTALELTGEYESTAWSGTVESCTKSLDNPELLGVFAEHLAERKQEQQYHPEARAYYLVDRFAARFRRFTQPVLNRRVTSSSFPNLRQWMRSAGEAEIMDAGSVWLHIHEWGHDSGLLPYHDNRVVKRKWPNSGFEELRVDLLAIVELLSKKSPLARVYAEYILADRLLAYAIVDLHNNRHEISFDTVGSQILVLHLIQRQALLLDGGRLRLLDNWGDAIRDISAEFEELEQQVALGIDGLQQREILKEYILKFTGTAKPQIPCSRISAESEIPILDFYFDAYRQIKQSGELEMGYEELS